MKIAFDCRYVRIGHHDGISRFSAGLVSELASLCAQSGHQLEMLVCDPRQLAKLPQLPYRLVTAPTSPKEPLVALQVNKGRYDVVFSPMQTMGSWFRNYRLLLTVHDLIYYSHPTPPPEFSAFIRGLWRLYHKAWWPQRMLLNGCNAVVAVSQTTKQLIQSHRLTRNPVYIVHNAADPFPAAKNRNVNRASRSLVYMGSFMPYKNVEFLVRAMHSLPGYVLELLSSVTTQMRQRLTDLAPVGSVIFHDGVDEDEYREILTRAHAAVSASREEGFGIPIIEAMTAGIPVVISDIPIFHEVAGDAAIYFDPSDEHTFAHAISRLESVDVWNECAQKSQVQAGRFSWPQSAQQLLNAIESTSR